MTAKDGPNAQRGSLPAKMQENGKKRGGREELRKGVATRWRGKRLSEKVGGAVDVPITNTSVTLAGPQS